MDPPLPTMESLKKIRNPFPTFKSVQKIKNNRYRTSSVCFKMKFDDVQKKPSSKDENLVVVYEMYQCNKCYQMFTEESLLTQHDCIFQVATNAPVTYSQHTPVDCDDEMFGSELDLDDGCDLEAGDSPLMCEDDTLGHIKDKFAKKHTNTCENETDAPCTCLEISENCPSTTQDYIPSDPSSFMKEPTPKPKSKLKLRLIPKDYKYDCDQCSLSFSQKAMLRKHRNQMHKVKRSRKKLTVYTCKRPNCGHQFTDRDLYVQHKKEHQVEEQFSCQPCGLIFPDKETKNEHRKSHFAEKKYACSECGKRFAYPKILEWHNRNVHLRERPKKDHRCDICDKVFQNSGNLKRHKFLHTPDELKPFVCEICNVRFPLKVYLTNHLVVHSNERPYMCDKCGRTFKTMPRLRFHCIYKHSEAPPLLRKSKKRSARKSYKPVKKFICEKCGKGFSNKYSMTAHTYTHTGETPFKCETCNKAFRYKEILRTHSQIHTNIRYQCEICEKMYVSKSSLLKHLKLHNENECFFCQYCGMRFAFKSALNTHIVSHTKEKPFECNVCHKRYSQKGSLTKHPCTKVRTEPIEEYEEQVVFVESCSYP